MRRSTIFTAVFMVALLGVATYNIKQCVLSIETELAQIHQNMLGLEESTSLLKAEWSYLNEPQRLQMLAEKHLNVQPAHGYQIVSLRDLPNKTAFEEGAIHLIKGEG